MVPHMVSTLVTVVVGVVAALAGFWALNRACEVLPGAWEDKVKPYVYIGPAVAAIVVFLVHPMIITVVDSFKDADSVAFVGWENYADLIGDPDFIDTVVTTLLWLAVVPAVSIVVGLGVATVADRLGAREERVLKTVVFMPMAISAVGAATVWRFVYAANPRGTEQIGLLNGLVTALGADPVAWLQNSDFRLNSFMLMVMMLWGQIGFSMVLLSAAVKGVPGDTLEAARLDGAGEVQIFFRVVVPQIRGTVLTVFVTVLITAMKVFDTIYVMTNGAFRTNVVGLEFFNQLYTNFDNGRASAIVVMLLVAIVPVMVFQVRRFKAEEEP